MVNRVFPWCTIPQDFNIHKLFLDFPPISWSWHLTVVHLCPRRVRPPKHKKKARSNRFQIFIELLFITFRQFAWWQIALFINRWICEDIGLSSEKASRWNDSATKRKMVRFTLPETNSFEAPANSIPTIHFQGLCQLFGVWRVIHQKLNGTLPTDPVQ